jgi:transposase
VAAPKKYPDELRARAVRLYRESDPKPVIRRLAEQLNVHPEALRNWIRQDQADRGERDDRPTSDMLEENRRLRKEVAKLRRVNEIPQGRQQLFRAGARPDPASVMRFVDEHRDRYAVALLLRVLDVTPSTSYGPGSGWHGSGTATGGVTALPAKMARGSGSAGTLQGGPKPGIRQSADRRARPLPPSDPGNRRAFGACQTE